MPNLTQPGGLFDPAQDFAFNLVPVAISAVSVAPQSNIATFTSALHGFISVLNALKVVPGYDPSTGGGVQLGVIINAGAPSTILNSTWLVTGAPTTATFTVQLTPAQAAQVTTFAGATATPFLTLPAGAWDVVLSAGDILQYSTTRPPGPVGGANTTVAGVAGGSTLPFGRLGNATGAPIGGGTYISWLTGPVTPNGDTIFTDGITYFLQFGVTPGISYIRKRAGTP